MNRADETAAKIETAERQSVGAATGSDDKLAKQLTWDDPHWQAFVKAYQDAWPAEKRFPTPSFCAVNYYDETTAALLALDKVNGDLSDGHKKFRQALASLVLDAPNGQIKLDENRQAIGTVFVTEVVKDQHGDLVNKVVKIVPNVQQRLGFSKEAFDRIGLPGREVPVCKKVYD
jgi:branched-chain amino acid transport system substrate-binding protein